MNRRNPTRIELKLDDLQEYEALKKQLEEKGSAKDAAVNTEQLTNPIQSIQSTPRTKSLAAGQHAVQPQPRN